MPTQTYAPPVNQLLSYGECHGQTWPDYVQDLGLTAEHVPALIQMVQDEELWAFFAGDYDREDEFIAAGITPDEALWAPIHAWRSLGQLQAAEAVETLVQVLRIYEYDWCWEELPQVFSLMGAGAIDPLDKWIASKIDYNNRIILSSGLVEIAKVFPDLRDRCVEVLTRHLKNFKHQHRSLNGALVTELLGLQALESLSVIEEAYTAKRVDEMFVGSWAKVQVDLGLKQASDFTPEELAIHYTPAQKAMIDNIKASVDQRQLKAFRAQLPNQRPGFEQVEFKDLASRSSSHKLSPKAGFGTGETTDPKKTKKKRKK